MVLGRAGRLDDARRLGEELYDRAGRGEYVSPTSLLALALGLGDAALVQQCLAACADGGAAPFAVVATTRWLLDTRRGDPAIDALLDRMHDGAPPPVHRSPGTTRPRNFQLRPTLRANRRSVTAILRGVTVPLALDLVQTVAFAGGLLFLGYGLKRLIPALARVNIPAPVCGGLPVAGILAVLYFWNIRPLRSTRRCRCRCRTPSSRRLASRPA